MNFYHKNFRRQLGRRRPKFGLACLFKKSESRKRARAANYLVCRFRLRRRAPLPGFVALKHRFQGEGFSGDATAAPDSKGKELELCSPSFKRSIILGSYLRKAGCESLFAKNVPKHFLKTTKSKKLQSLNFSFFRNCQVPEKIITGGFLIACLVIVFCQLSFLYHGNVRIIFEKGVDYDGVYGGYARLPF